MLFNWAVYIPIKSILKFVDFVNSVKNDLGILLAYG